MTIHSQIKNKPVFAAMADDTDQGPSLQLKFTGQRPLIMPVAATTSAKLRTPPITFARPTAKVMIKPEPHFKETNHQLITELILFKKILEQKHIGEQQQQYQAIFKQRQVLFQTIQNQLASNKQNITQLVLSHKLQELNEILAFKHIIANSNELQSDLIMPELLLTMANTSKDIHLSHMLDEKMAHTIVSVIEKVLEAAYHAMEDEEEDDDEYENEICPVHSRY